MDSPKPYDWPQGWWREQRQFLLDELDEVAAEVAKVKVELAKRRKR